MTRLTLQERRGELIAATVRLVSREGLAAATTRAVVAEADMPLGAFHYAFASRDELLACVVESVTERERLASAAVVGRVPADATLEDVLHAGLASYLQMLADDPGSEQALLELTLYSLRHGLDTLVQAQYATYLRAVEENLRLAARATDHVWTVPVTTAARYLLVGVDGLTTTWLALRDTAAALEAARFLARSVAALAEPAGPDGAAAAAVAPGASAAAVPALDLEPSADLDRPPAPATPGAAAHAD